MPYIIMSIVVSSLCPVIMVMNNKEVLFRTKCSSMKESSINFQTILASTIFVAFIWLLLMGMGIMKNGEMLTEWEKNADHGGKNLQEIFIEKIGGMEA